SVNPGFGGQSFIEPVLEKTRQFCRWRAAGHYSWLIAMDGGLGLENAGRIARAGCDVLVMGSAIFGAPDPAERVLEIRRRVKEAMNGA
ncbi:MAG: ribulose-phosphate 3-epimerase, partial [Synergistaceae bacterium]|nr:ribulose-phosphate 3-epimerase [Synergistaceae bacterium]